MGTKFWQTLAAAAGALTIATTASAKDLIAFSVSDAGHPFYNAMVQGVKDQAKEMGYEALILDARKNIAKQISDAEDALQRDVEVLLINGVDKGSVRIAQMYQDQDIPVIMMQRDYGGKYAESFIGTDNVDVGEQMVHWFAKQTQNESEVKTLFITGIPGAGSSEDRIKGFEKALKNYEHIKILAKQTGEYDRAKALQVVENLLQRHPDTEAILCLNDEMAMGALAAAKAHGKEDIKIMGIDGNADAIKAVAAGQLYATMAFSPYNIGRQGVRSADKLLKGESVSSRQIAEVSFVTEENASQFLE